MMNLASDRDPVESCAKGASLVVLLPVVAGSFLVLNEDNLCESPTKY